MCEHPEMAGVVWFSFDAPPGENPPRGWRQELLPVLKSFGDEHAAEDVVLATGELVANAMEHGGGIVAMHVEGREGDVRVEVYDHRSALSLSSPADSDRGRGLAMVDALAEDWGWVPVAGGKLVWARFGHGRELHDAS